MRRRQLLIAILAAALGWGICFTTAEARFLRRAENFETAAARAPALPSNDAAAQVSRCLRNGNGWSTAPRSASDFGKWPPYFD